MKVFYSSPWVPVEWIEAHGFEPRGVWCAKDFGRSALPLSAGVCAFSEAVLRFAETHQDLAVVFTTTCDQMRRGFDAFAAAHGGRAFLFNLPATWQSGAARRMFQSEIERLGRFLQAHGGRAPLVADLAQVVERRSQARKHLLELAPRCPARPYAEAVARFHWDGSIGVPAPPPPPPAPGSIPVAVVGGPLTASQRGLLDLIEAAGARVVLNATETGERSLLPPFALNDSLPESERRAPARQEGTDSLAVQRAERVLGAPDARFMAPLHASTSVATADDPLGFLARNYLENIVDVFQRPNTRLYSWLGERLTARGARGIVLWVHTGCDLWRAEAQTLREIFRLPVLLLEADEASGGSAREAGRIQAFVETLQ